MSPEAAHRAGGVASPRRLRPLTPPLAVRPAGATAELVGLLAVAPLPPPPGRTPKRRLRHLRHHRPHPQELWRRALGPLLSARMLSRLAHRPMPLPKRRHGLRATGRRRRRWAAVPQCRPVRGQQSRRRPYLPPEQKRMKTRKTRRMMSRRCASAPTAAVGGRPERQQHRPLVVGPRHRSPAAASTSRAWSQAASSSAALACRPAECPSRAPS
mmetsp:Transcript_97182/g.279741  ORF Transcript_97182/g.279741 Transcript_97182/m.279741 type:complete len:213 (+) Transcript_97182:742-1380(+)